MKRTVRTVLALLMGLALIATGCGDDDGGSVSSDGTGSASEPGTASGAESPTVTIGAQDFGESAILAEIYKQGLEAKGFEVKLQKLGGFRDLELTAFDKGTINFAPEYAASMLEALNGKKGEASGDVTATVEKLQAQLTAKKLKALKASSAVDTNAFVVTKATADKLGLRTLSDLAAKGKDLKLGAPADCETNAFCLSGLKKTYGLDLAGKLQSLEAAAIAPALDAGSIDVALLFSTDGRIKAKGYVLLEDDKKLLAADNVVPVVSDELAADADLVAAVDAISAKLTTALLIDMNKAFDVDKEDAAVIAKGFLEDHDLL